jgi:hypothetical protein
VSRGGSEILIKVAVALAEKALIAIDLIVAFG